MFKTFMSTTVTRESLEKTQAFFKSKTWADFKSKIWTDLGPDRDKALKTLGRHKVEER